MEKIEAYNWKKILRANWLKLSANFENFVSSLLDRLEESKEPQADVFLEMERYFLWWLRRIGRGFWMRFQV